MSDTKPLRRRTASRITLLRWIDIFAMAAISAASTFFFLKPLEKVSRFLSEPFNSHVGLFVAISILGTAAAFPLYKSGCLRPTSFNIKNSASLAIRYPSIIWSVLLGSIGILAVERPPKIDIATLSLACVTTALIHDAWHWLRYFVDQRLQRNQTARIPAQPDVASLLFSASPSETFNHLTKDPAVLYRWLASDDSVERLDDDLFGRDFLVSRVEKAIASSRGNTIGILGDFGSGKTSLIQMARQSASILNNRVAIFVVVETWGVKPSDLAEAILQSGVDRLSQEVDCIALGGLPREYAQAIEASGSRWAQAFGANHHSSPLSQLKRLDQVLAALGRKLVFVFEDIDRNTSPDTLTEIYVGFQALLDQMRKCPNLSFVLAMADTAFDFDRLCDIKIAIPRLEMAQAGALTQAFRYHLLLDALEKGTHIPNRTRLDIEAIGKKIPTGSFSWHSEENMPSDVSLRWEHILPLLSTPRRLKSMLKHLREAWENLKGEVEFDELLVLQTIRSTAPQLMDELTSIRRSRDPFSLNESQESKSTKKKEILERLRGVLNGTNEEEQAHLIELVSPIIGAELGSHGSLIRTIGRGQPTQTIDDGGDIYWGRIWSGHVGNPRIPSDQSVLQEIRNWKEDPKSIVFAKQLENTNGFADVFERLMRNNQTLTQDYLLNFPELVKLATLVHDEVIFRQREHSSRDTSESFIPIWRLSNKLYYGHKDLALSWTKAEITRLLPHSLRLALDVAHYWGTGQHAVTDQSGSEEVKKCLLPAIRSNWQNDPKHILSSVSACQLSHVFSLAHLINYSCGEASDPLIADNWKWLIDLLRKSLELDPSRISPLIAALAVGGSHATSREPGEEWRVSAVLRPERVCQMIPEDNERLAFFKIVLDKLKTSDRSGWDDLVSAWSDQAIATLGKWVKEGTPSETELSKVDDEP